MAPAELEAVLLTHPLVINAAVIGIPLKNGTGEVPQAFVILKPKLLDGSYASHGELEEQETNEEEIKAYLASRLAKYKALNGVTFVDDIPRTAAGKLMKFKLKELYESLPQNERRAKGAEELKTNSTTLQPINGTNGIVKRRFEDFEADDSGNTHKRTRSTTTCGADSLWTNGPEIRHGLTARSVCNGI